HRPGGNRSGEQGQPAPEFPLCRGALEAGHRDGRTARRDRIRCPAPGAGGVHQPSRGVRRVRFGDDGPPEISPLHQELMREYLHHNMTGDDIERELTNAGEEEGACWDECRDLYDPYATGDGGGAGAFLEDLERSADATYFDLGGGGGGAGSAPIQPPTQPRSDRPTDRDSMERGDV